MIKLFTDFAGGNDERSIVANKNILLSFVLKGFSIGISLLLVPMTIRYVDISQYGVWLTLSSLIGLFNFFDVGLGNGLRNQLAESNALNQTKRAQILVSTTYAIVTIISVCLFFLFCIVNAFLNWNSILNVPVQQGIDLNILALVVFGAFCIQLILQILFSVLTAYHAIAKVSLVMAAGQFFSLVVVFFLNKYTTGSLLLLVVTLSGVPIITQVASTIFYFRNGYRLLAPNLKLVKFGYAKSLLSTGGLFFFIQLGSLLLFQSDNIVIAQLWGPAEVTVFNSAYKLFSVIILIFTIVMNPFWTAFTDAYTKGDMLWIRRTLKKIYRYWFGLVIVSLILLVASPFVFQIWLGASVKVPIILSLFMVLYVISICWMMISNFFLNGVSKLWIQFILYLICTMINIPLCIVFGRWFGLVGVSVSNLIVVLFMATIMALQCNRIVNGVAKGVWNR